MVESIALSLLAQSLVLEPVTLLVGTKYSELSVDIRKRLTHRVETLPLALIHAVLARAPETKEIITPLFSENFDATELAYELFRADYTGILTVLVPNLPEPDLVTEELRSICPDAKLQIALHEPIQDNVIKPSRNMRIRS